LVAAVGEVSLDVLLLTATKDTCFTTVNNLHKNNNFTHNLRLMIRPIIYLVNMYFLYQKPSKFDFSSVTVSRFSSFTVFTAIGPL
jgi:hypothetical protein